LHCARWGINTNGQWQKQARSDKYLFPVKALSKVFREKYVTQLRSGSITDKPLLESLFDLTWVVFAKRPFAVPTQVIEYLGRYTHKVAISNHRIKQVQNRQVAFSYKDYRHKCDHPKLMTIPATEFIRRFAQHILPHRFVRIRH
jgi:Putative transposase